MWAAAIPAIAQGIGALANADAKTAQADAQWMAGPSVGASSGAGGIFTSVDHSGWTVSTGSSTARATAGDRGGMTGGSPAPHLSDAVGLGDSLSGSGINPTVAVVAVGLIVLAFIVSKHK